MGQLAKTGRGRSEVGALAQASAVATCQNKSID